MKIKILSLATLALAVAVSSAAMAGSVTVGKSSKGNVLTDSHGMTLYTFAKDSAGKSNCNGGCAEKWPPVSATSKAMADGEYSVITRNDGSKQWAYKGMALYTWFKDKAAGDTTGDGVKGVWHLARP